MPLPKKNDVMTNRKDPDSIDFEEPLIVRRRGFCIGLFQLKPGSEDVRARNRNCWRQDEDGDFTWDSYIFPSSEFRWEDLRFLSGTKKWIYHNSANLIKGLLRRYIRRRRQKQDQSRLLTYMLCINLNKGRNTCETIPSRLVDIFLLSTMKHDKLDYRRAIC